LSARVPSTVDLVANETKKISVYISLARTSLDQSYVELNALIHGTALQGSVQTPLHVPIMAMFSTRTQIRVEELAVLGGANDSVESVARLAISNSSDVSGEAYPFNLLGIDDAKPIPGRRDSHKMTDCDLEAVGYKVITRQVTGKNLDVLQVAAKVREPLTSWLFCEVSVQFDTNRDHLADQELAGIFSGIVAGFPGFEPVSVLLDSVRARGIRQAFESSLAKGAPIDLDYKPATLAVGPMRAFDHSTLAIVETPLEAIGLRPDGRLAIKVATLSGTGEALEGDDFLGNSLNEWITIDPRADAAPFKDLPEVIKIDPKSNTEVEFVRGVEEGRLVLFMPRNSAARTRVNTTQMELPIPKYQAVLKIK
jgi:hypothetical protein